MRQFFSKLTTIVLLCATISIISSCSKDTNTESPISSLSTSESSDVLLSWMDLSLLLTQEAPGYTAPISARAYAYIGLGLHESMVQAFPGHKSVMSKINDGSKSKLPKFGGDIHWNLLVNEYMYTICNHFYYNSTPVMIKAIQDLYAKNLAALEVTADVNIANRSKNFGKIMANAIFDYSKTDGQEYGFMNNYPNDYRGPVGQGVWNAARSQTKRPLQPYWGDVRTFFNENINLHLGSTPPSFSTDKNSVFYAYALEVKIKAKSMGLYQENLVRFWNDEAKGSYTPAGHFVSILSSLVKKENKNLAEASEAFMKLGLCMHDVTVAIWKTKYTFNTVGADDYIKTYIDNNFLTLMASPATPEFSSGQAAIASGAAEVFGQVFGYNYAFTDVTYEYRKDIDGSPRSFKNFQQMADEASIANLYGGIHYRFSIEEGVKQGIQIGENISKL